MEGWKDGGALPGRSGRFTQGASKGEARVETEEDQIKVMPLI